MTKTTEQINNTPTGRVAFWDEVWEAADQIERLNDSDGAALDNLTKVQVTLEALETAGTGAYGLHTAEVVFLVAAVAQAISGATFEHYVAAQAAE